MLASESGGAGVRVCVAGCLGPGVRLSESGGAGARVCVAGCLGPGVRLSESGGAGVRVWVAGCLGPGVRVSGSGCAGMQPFSRMILSASLSDPLDSPWSNNNTPQLTDGVPNVLRHQSCVAELTDVARMVASYDPRYHSYGIGILNDPPIPGVPTAIIMGLLMNTNREGHWGSGRGQERGHEEVMRGS
jgi:hypothetical protein